MSFSIIRLSCQVTETDSGVIGNILQNVERTSYAALSNANSSLVNTITKNPSKISKMAVRCKSCKCVTVIYFKGLEK